MSRQTVLQTGDFDRDELEEIESEMNQKTRLWQGIQTFEEHLQEWECTSFESLDIGAMEAEVVRYEATRENVDAAHPGDLLTVEFRSLFVCALTPLTGRDSSRYPYNGTRRVR